MPAAAQTLRIVFQPGCGLGGGRGQVLRLDARGDSGSARPFDCRFGSAGASLRVAQDDAPLFIDAYGVTEGGNFEGKNILYIARDLDVLAGMRSLSMDEVATRLAAARRKLFEVREKRVRPARDEKVLTGWNGLMLVAFAEAARVLKREDYRSVAERNADFILRERVL